MKIKCPECETIISTSFSYLGITIECPSCSKTFKSDHSQVTDIGETGFDLDYLTFIQLMKNADLKDLHQKIEKWFACRIIDEKKKLLILNKENEILLPVAIHLAIQYDEKKKKDLYQMAMSILR